MSTGVEQARAELAVLDERIIGAVQERAELAAVLAAKRLGAGDTEHDVPGELAAFRLYRESLGSPDGPALALIVINHRPGESS